MAERYKYADVAPGVVDSCRYPRFSHDWMAYVTWGGDLLSAGHKAVLLVERSPRFLTLLTDRISHKAGQEFEIWSSFVPSFLPFSSLFISGQVPLGLFADQSIFKNSKTPFEQVGCECCFLVDVF